MILPTTLRPAVRRARSAVPRRHAVPVLAGLVAAFAFSPGPAGAGLVCGERDKIVATLEDRYGESRRALGIQNDGNRVMELYASDKGSWTAVVTDTKGRACILGVGEAWTEFEPEPVGPAA